MLDSSRCSPLPAFIMRRFEMRLHKRLIDLHSPAEVVKQITSIRCEEILGVVGTERGWG